MKIECEHCGAFIDVTRDKKCNNCGAPYNKNKEYLKKLMENNSTKPRKTPEDKFEELKFYISIGMLIILMIIYLIFRIF